MALWDELLPMTQLLNGKVLDVGCGNGVYTRRMLDEVDSIKSVVSLDLLPSNEVRAGSRYVDNVLGGTYIQADIQEAPFADNEFDSILAWHVIEHCLDPSKALREISRVTKMGGLVFFAMPIRDIWEKATENATGAKRPSDWVGTPLEHHNYWNPGEFENLVKDNGFEPAGVAFIDSQDAQNRLYRVTKGYIRDIMMDEPRSAYPNSGGNANPVAFTDIQYDNGQVDEKPKSKAKSSRKSRRRGSK